LTKREEATRVCGEGHDDIKLALRIMALEEKAVPGEKPDGYFRTIIEIIRKPYRGRNQRGILELY
jgi:hypothetical protein